MLVILNPNPDCYFNLASEEYLFHQFDEDIFMLWQNDNTIVVGKNQNTLAEINYEYVKENGIKVVRRMTGGGAVYHDMGNINFTFIERNASEHFNNYARFTKPIIEVLQSLGVDAQLSGRNDLLIEGKKFSGNAQYANKESMMHHGTLMFASSIKNVSAALNVNPLKIQSKNIKSVVSRVTNISTHLKTDTTLDEFCSLIVEKILKEYPNAHLHEFTQQDIDNITSLVEQKYGTWDWNFGVSGKYSFEKQSYFTGGLFDVNLQIERGIITAVRFYGDYFGKRDVNEFEQKLIGKKHQETEISALLDEIPIESYFAGVTKEQILEAMF